MRGCYGVEFPGRADRDLAVPAMKVRGRWSRAVLPPLSGRGAPIAFFSPQRFPRRHFSGELCREEPPAGIWVPDRPRAEILGIRSSLAPTAIPVREPEERGEAGRPQRSRPGPLPAPGPVRVLGGLRQTHECSLQPSAPLPVACILPP